MSESNNEKVSQEILEASLTESPFMFKYPAYPTERMAVRMEMLRQLDMWENNDTRIAQDLAKSLIDLIIRQFSLDKKI